MRNPIRKAVFCVVVSISIATISWSSEGGSWYSPFFSELLEDGEILGISLQCENGEVIQSDSFIDPGNRTLSVQVPEGVDRAALVPEFKVSEGFVVQPEPGVSSDFSEVVNYTLHCERSNRSLEWRVNVFDGDTGMIFTGEDFKDWKLKSSGYDHRQHFGDYLDNRDGLFFRLAEPIEHGSWALFYFENERPVRRIGIIYDKQRDHNNNVNLQVLDLAGVESDDLAKKGWPQDELDATGKRVRWNRLLGPTPGISYRWAAFSDDPIKGPIALQYGGAVREDYRIHVKKVMFTY